jgi:hypothetical protein
MSTYLDLLARKLDWRGNLARGMTDERNEKFEKKYFKCR